MGNDEINQLPPPKRLAPETEVSEEELNLGLSLGGRFGTDRVRKRRIGIDRGRNSWLVRSSTVAGALPTLVNDINRAPLAAAGLDRTSSLPLPLQIEEEWRKRREAKRRRSLVDLNITPVSPEEESKKEEMRKMLASLPTVFTMAKNDKRMDGILYKYGSLGDDVKIICLCHGSFHSPEEFINHAGGVEVDNPLKHIVVNVTSLHHYH